MRALMLLGMIGLGGCRQEAPAVPLATASAEPMASMEPPPAITPELCESKPGTLGCPTMPSSQGASPSPAGFGGSGGTYVHGYTRSNGTQVRGYTRGR